MNSNSRVFLLDKPVGISSFMALDNLKRTLGTAKVGHAGTLDPFATGLLVVLSGKLTKAAYLFSRMDKDYESVIRFGVETNTLDVEGKVVAEAPVPDFHTIKRIVDNYTGNIIQTPPAFSAVKINGDRSYRLAREGLEVDIPKRSIRIYSFRIIKWTPPNLRVHIRCSSGTYVRSLSRDIGIACDSRAFCYSLRRLSIGPFSVRDAMEPDRIDKTNGYGPVELAQLVRIPTVLLPDEVAEKLRMGVSLNRLKRWLPKIEAPTLCISSDKEALAMLDIKRGQLAYRIVF
ncbi:tRNA pseudouridine(55) synthase [Olavius algarvensis spirochete endosymbiont]|nr:hypothetical protein JY97_01130 [Alkalispirochaeta odontotermitis]CAD7837618.1 MAG: tRNA pseudouridine(55) synthase (EC 5.4.99.25) [Olavius algarvensis spirochete endosymbiont]VDA99818.1 tRNA pseudouridine(55) synthase [Olavius algarvensis spirochete endosymbiont]